MDSPTKYSSGQVWQMDMYHIDFIVYRPFKKQKWQGWVTERHDKCKVKQSGVKCGREPNLHMVLKFDPMSKEFPAYGEPR